MRQKQEKATERSIAFEIHGAGDGNRTRVTSLGSLGNNHYTTPATAHYYTPAFLQSPNNSTKSPCGQTEGRCGRYRALNAALRKPM